MGQPIKFRIWSYESSKFISMNYRAGDPSYDNQYSNCIFQQFLGKTQDNIELYEGDIIRGVYTLDRIIEGPITYSQYKWVVSGVDLSNIMGIEILSNIFEKVK